MGQPPPTSTGRADYCQQCGAAALPGARYCGECGAQLERGQTPGSTTPPPPARVPLTKRPAAVLSAVGCLVVALVVIAGGVWWAARGRHSQARAAPPAVTEGKTPDLLAALRTADSGAAMQAAVSQVVCAGLSLGLCDDSGRQLNPQVGEDAVSLTPAAVAAQAGLALQGQGRRLSSVVEFLAGAGVQLSATQRTVTVEDLLPEIQQYVERSCTNRSESGSTLGLLLASGTDFTPPESVPRLTGNTVISNLAGLLLVSDILLGVEQPESQQAWLRFATPAWADDDETAPVSRLKGLITRIEPQLAHQGLKVPEAVRVLIGAYEACDRLSIRILSSYAGQDVVKPTDILDPITFTRSGESVFISLVTVLEPDQTVLRGVPIAYSGDLVSDDQEYLSFVTRPEAYVAHFGREAPLYPDCDAVIVSAGGPEGGDALAGLWTGDGSQGHRTECGTSSENDPAVDAGLLCTRLENRQRRMAALVVMGEVHIQLVVDIMRRFDRKVGVEGLVYEDFEDFEVLLIDLSPSPGDAALLFEPPTDEETPLRAALLKGVLYSEPYNDEPPIADLTLDFTPPRVKVTIIPREGVSGFNLSRWPRIELQGELAERHGWGYLVFEAEGHLPVPEAEEPAPMRLKGSIEPTYQRLLDDQQLNFKDLPDARALDPNETDRERFYYAFGSVTFGREMLWQAAE
jgi:hypothetical protein